MKLSTEYLILSVSLHKMNLYSKEIICTGTTIKLKLLYDYSNYKIIEKLKNKTITKRLSNYYEIEVNIYDEN